MDSLQQLEQSARTVLHPLFRPMPVDFGPRRVLVNDARVGLSPTIVDRVLFPSSVQELREALRCARRLRLPVSIAGSRSSTAGQQFGTHSILIDTRMLSAVLGFDRETGTVEVEAGIQWPKLVCELVKAQEGEARQWGVAQQSPCGAARSIGGALSANVHGRGLRMRPLVSDVESFTLIGIDGELIRCSRTENSELFRLAIGGFGLFGVIYSATIRLTPRQKLMRYVQLLDVDQLDPVLEQRISDGHLYGHLQLATDPRSGDFLRGGVFCTYRPVGNATPIPEGQLHLSEEDWKDLLCLAHTEKRRAFDTYAAHYLATDGQIYWSDTHQLSPLQLDCRRPFDRGLGDVHRAKEIMTEVFVPRAALPGFMMELRQDFRASRVDLLHATVRWTERDDESFLAWAKAPYACVELGLGAAHRPEAMNQVARTIRRLIDMSVRRGGSYSSTYHRYARADQVRSCYPEFYQFLGHKKKHDPEERFQSDWYRHHKELLTPRH